MNIVKGVADLIRRTSGGQTVEINSGTQTEKFTAPTPRIRFRQVGDEAILHTLWERYESATDKVEKKNLLHVFLKQFLDVYKNWEPVGGGQMPEAYTSNDTPAEFSSRIDGIVDGCSAGHPAEITLILIEEVTKLTAAITEWTTIDVTSTSDRMPVLDALAIVTRSMHNCRVFGYYGGMQKLTALMKAAVVQLKTTTSAVSAEDSLSDSIADKIGFLQKLLVYVVSIICSFIDLDSNIYERASLCSNTLELSVPGGVYSPIDNSSLNSAKGEAKLHWHQKAIVSVMEAGGLNWLVELLRVIRRLSVKEHWTDASLQYLSLRTLHSALSENPRGQNHFRSIGGLEVLLDGLVPANSVSLLKKSFCDDRERCITPVLSIFQLHVLSLEVLREAVFGSLNNLQFLCENGRIHKFANSFCSPAFLLQEYNLQDKDIPFQEKTEAPVFQCRNENHVQVHVTEHSDSLPANASYLQCWIEYVVNLSRVLCSFILFPGDINSSCIQLSSIRNTMPISSLYTELSIKWAMGVLHTVFPCIKACSNQSELPSQLRIFVNTLQHYVLNAFRKVLVVSPLLLEVFRHEGMWDLIFSENFFYFGPASDNASEESCTFEGVLRVYDCTPVCTDSQVKVSGVEILQMEAISFVEFAATFNDSAHNLPECSVLLDTLEQAACSPEIARVVAKTLICILRLSAEKTVVSFKTLNAIPRVLKVACIQAQELRRSSNSFDQSSSVDIVPAQGSSSSESSHSWMESMETSIELFIDYLALADDAKTLIMHSTTCVDCLFDLFWEEGLRNRVLTHVLDLMKIVPFSEDDHKAKLYLCSKYLELFTQIKEQEKCFAELSIDLLVGMRDMLLFDQEYFQGLFRDGECFLHVVSLLNGNLDESNGEKLVLNVLQTLTSLLANNDISKAAFRALVGKGYQTLQSLLLDFCQWQPSEGLLNRLLDMLADGKFDIKASPMIKNEDVIILYLSVLQKSSDLLRNYGLNVFQQLIRDSISNRASCVRAGMLNFLLDWYSEEDKDSVILKITQLIQVIGGHSISGKDIRKIFALLRSDKAGSRQQYSSLLLTSVLSMLNEKGPTAFFDLNGNNSGVKIKTLQWPLNKGFSFSCWLRVESFPRNGMLGLFSFLTENGKGCYALLAKDKLVYESINQKRQCVALKVNIIRKKWHFLCLTHSIGRAFSGGSLLKCYVDGEFVSSERCRYAKINEPMTNCGIGRKLNLSSSQEDNSLYSIKDSCSFLGQIGPIYMFNDAITSDLVKGMYSLGPSYMYSFLDNEVALFCDNPLPSGILDAKDGLASRIIFGLNAQASDGRSLFNVAPISDSVIDTKVFEASVLFGTQLCSRRLLQQIIYCVGGVSVFFPLLTQSNRYEIEKDKEIELSFFRPITRERPTAEVIELIASVLDENIANQQQMHLLSGFLILGFLLQSVPPQHLNLETLSALKHIFNVIGNGGLSEVLVKSAISSIFLNPLIWVYTAYKVQRELYLFLIQQFDNDPRLYKSLCRLPHVMDIIRQFYWDTATSRYAIGSKPLLHPISKEVIGERPNKEEIHKIRLVLLSLGETSLRQNIEVSDIKSLIAFFETSQDMACIEDVLHMVIRSVSQKTILASFLEQVNLVGGCHIFVNLLRRDYEPVRLLSLQFLGRLLVALPSERKGPRFFNLAVVRTRPHSESQRKISSRMQTIFSAMSDRLFSFPQTDHLCATLFDVLLGGASPKQVLQKHNQPEKQKSKVNSSHFFLPQILVLIFRFLSNCEDRSARVKIIGDLLDLLNANFSNIESLMEYGWTVWLEAAMKLDVFKSYEVASQNQCDEEKNEQKLIRILFSVVLCHCTRFIKSGWQHMEETVNFLLAHCEQDAKLSHSLLRDIYEDLIRKLVELSSEENIFSSQPCRDNTLYLLRMVDEMLISEMNKKLPFPGCSSDFSLDSLEIESLKDFSSALYEALHGESNSQIRNMQICKNPLPEDDEIAEEKWWTVYDNLWIIICEMNGKGPSKILPKSTSSVGPSLGQRARGLVESLNIPAAEMAAVVVSGGIGNALGGKSNKNIDKAMLLRGEKFPKIIFRLVILYLCRSSLERASRCVQQVISLLPCLLVTDDEQSKSRLQLFIWSLLAVRSQYGMLDEGARFHVISHLIRETVNCGKSVLASGIIGRDESSETGSNARESTTLHNLIQKDLVLTAVADEAKYIQNSNADRNSQLHELRIKMGENLSTESNQRKAFEDEIQSSLNTILTSDENRRAAFQLARDEEQQNVAEKWIHMFRALIDERGPWSSNPFPNCAVAHWKLDKTEDTWRRRPKLRRNYRFDEKLCHPPSNSPSTETVLSTSETKSSFGLHVPEQMKRFLLKGVRRITDESSDNDTDQSGQEASVPVKYLDNMQSDLIKDSNDPKDIIHEWKDPSSSSQEKETSEVLLSVQSVLVTPKRKLAGHLAVLKNVMHFFGECLIEGTGGSSVFRNFTELNGSDTNNFEHGGDQKNKFVKLPSNIYLDSEKGIVADNIDTVYDYLLKRKIKNIKRHRRWEISKIKAVHLTRYLLGYTALEIFFNNSVAPVFFNFASQKDANDVGMLIVATRNESLFPKGSTRDKNYAISFVDRRVAQEMAETARESWRRREMTNFEYLLILNTLAGRSYNDLTQYPVFPWVLADYSSETLDFNKSSTFRDLSKPIGALDPKRLEVFEDRYRNFSDPDIPSFYYGSHYSSMGIVLYYLLRLEPFTSLHRYLQGGKFDHADRLFQSINGTYQNCLSNTSDVKELIPEFFYMPEFLVNSSSYHLGVKQDGDPIGDVCLPPWAKGSPEEFINRNREALESEYVSSNLHHWIDLIFGYKQRGKPAVEAANIFYYVTYEGAVDLDTMDDELQRSAIEDQIANFGQTPIQIFHKKHPRRGPPIPIAHPLYFAPGSINLTSIISSPIYPVLAVLFLGMLESNIVIVNEGLAMSVKMWVTTQLQSGGNFSFSGSQDPFFGIGSDILSPRKIGSPLAENIELGAQCFAIMPTPSENFLISCGSWENSFQVISLNDGRLVQSIRQHKDVVSCVAVTSDGSVLATGSYDTTVMVWEVAKAKTMEKRVRSAQTELPRKDYVIVETPFHILCGHDDIITCLYVSVELDIVISGSRDGTCVLHTLREGRYVKSLRHPSGRALSKLVVSRHGLILFYSDDDLSLHLYSINGKHIASSESNGRLNCVELSCCGEFLVCAGDQGQITVRSMNSLEIVRKYNGIGKIITSLTVTPEECFLAGTKDGSLLVYSIDNPQLRKATLPRNAKSKAPV